MQPEEEDRVESGQDPTDPDYPSEPGGQETPSSASIAAHLDERGGDRTDRCVSPGACENAASRPPS